MAEQTIQILRLGSLSPADAAMRGHKCSFLIEADRIALEGENFGLAREIYGRRSYLADGLSIHAGDIVIDLGANSGVFSILAARLGARVIAVEAQRKELSRLHGTLELNPSYAGAVTPVHALVGAGAGLLSGWSVSDFGGEVPAPISIEQLLARFDLDRIDFLKVDVEGAEFALINEDADWLDATRCIAMEVHGSFGDSARMVDALGRRNFRVDLRRADGREVSGIGRQAGYLYAVRRERWRAGGDRGRS